MFSNNRTRILLAALAVTAIAGALLYEVDDSPIFRRSAFSTPTPMPGAASPARDTGATATIFPPPSPTLSDSEYKALIDGYGAVMVFRESYDSHPADTGSFYFVWLSDSSRNLGDLGFVPATSLVAGETRLQALSDSGMGRPLRVADATFMQRGFRTRMDGCIDEIRTPVRGAEGGPSWLLALAAGGAESIPPDRWMNPVLRRDSAAIGEAVRVAMNLPLDSVEKDGQPTDSGFRSRPLMIETHYRLKVDDAEIMVVNARREGEITYTESGKSSTRTIYEQRVAIAERSGPSGEFHVRWHRYAAGDPDEITTGTPTLIFRLGRERLLTVYLDEDYKDGNGGTFLSRVGSGTWREVARWVGGC